MNNYYKLGRDFAKIYHSTANSESSSPERKAYSILLDLLGNDDSCKSALRDCLNHLASLSAASDDSDISKTLLVQKIKTDLLREFNSASVDAATEFCMGFLGLPFPTEARLVNSELDSHSFSPDHPIGQASDRQLESQPDPVINSSAFREQISSQHFDDSVTPKRESFLVVIGFLGCVAVVAHVPSVLIWLSHYPPFVADTISFYQKRAKDPTFLRDIDVFDMARAEDIKDLTYIRDCELTYLSDKNGRPWATSWLDDHAISRLQQEFDVSAYKKKPVNILGAPLCFIYEPRNVLLDSFLKASPWL